MELEIILALCLIFVSIMFFFTLFFSALALFFTIRLWALFKIERESTQKIIIPHEDIPSPAQADDTEIKIEDFAEEIFRGVNGGRAQPKTRENPEDLV